MEPSRVRHGAYAWPEPGRSHGPTFYLYPTSRYSVRIRRLIAWLPLVLAGLVTPAQADFELENAFPNLTFQTAVDIQVPNSASNNNRIFVVEKRGVISVFPEASTSR